MSYTFTLSGTKSILQANINPPIVLDEESEYVVGLINFETFNSIPNVDRTNNKFYIVGEEPVTIPEGSYEISDINRYLRVTLRDPRERTSAEVTLLQLKGNNNTLKTELKCNKVVDFTRENSLRTLLGFDAKQLKAGKLHESDHTANIFKVNAICIDCSLVSGSYRNDEEVHIIHQMFPDVPPGFKIVDNPSPVIYLPINTRVIDSITLKILDQDGDFINLRGETVTVRLHLKKL